MKLTREQRFLLMRGGHPRLAFDADKPCPVKVGDVRRLSPRVELEVLGIQRTKKGEWVLEYLVRDHRPTLLRRTPQVHVHETDQYGDVLPPTPGDIEAARLDSSYTHSTHGAISDAGEAVPEIDQELLTMRARERWAERAQGEGERKQQERAVREQLRDALAGLDPPAQSALLARISREIEGARVIEDAA